MNVAALEAERWVHLAYADGAMLTCLVADYFHTLEDEVDLIWTDARTWSSPRILFIFARYITFIDVTILVFYARAWRPPLNFFDESWCSIHLLAFIFAFGIIGNAASQALMSLRVLALAQAKKWAKAWLIVQFIITQGLCIGIMVAMVVRLVESTSEIQPICPRLQLDPSSNEYTFTNSWTWGYTSTIDPTTGPTALFSIMLFHQVVVTALGFFFLHANFRHLKTPLYQCIFRNGMFFFVVMTVVDSLCVYYSKTRFVGPTGGAYLLAIQQAFHASVTTRIMIVIRRTARDRTQCMSGVPTDSRMVFQQNAVKSRRDQAAMELSGFSNDGSTPAATTTTGISTSHSCAGEC